MPGAPGGGRHHRGSPRAGAGNGADLSGGQPASSRPPGRAQRQATPLQLTLFEDGLELAARAARVARERRGAGFDAEWLSPEGARARRRRLEEALPGYRLRFDPLRDPRVEHALFPAMIALYWELVRPDGTPPTQATFAEAVADRLPGLPRPAVVARASRTYPSLVRQHHFELVLREHFLVVVRAHWLDLSGLDFLLVEDGRPYGLGLSVETTTAHRWAGRKAVRHPPPAHIPVLQLYVRPHAYVIGDFWLHHPAQVEEVRAFIAREAARQRAARGWAG